MVANWCIVVTLVTFIGITTRAAKTPRLLGHFSAPNAAFVGIYKDTHASDARDKYSLFIGGFNAVPFSSDHVYEVRKIGRHLGAISSIHPTTVTTKITWPNEVAGVPDSIFAKEMVAVPGGFLVPLKTHGAIALFDTSHDPPKGPYYITNNHGNDASWFYHRIIWKDMDGDGDMDVLTARANKPIIGSAHGELLWYENPGHAFAQEFQNPWKSHILARGPDVYFITAELHAGSSVFDVIITAGFFSEKIEIFWTTDPAKHWTDSSKIHSKVIESSIGAVFDVHLVDLNKNGKMDLLVTTNKQDGAGIYAYEFPSDFRTGTFTKHTLASGFHAKFNLFGRSGAVGSAYAFNEPATDTGKPVIVVSGDDDGKAYLLESHSASHTDWQYSKTAFLELGSDTVGEIAFADVNGDGHMEMFIPDYNKGVVYVYTFAAA